MNKYSLFFFICILISCSSQKESFRDSSLLEASLYKATITRDIWGVPHIQGKRDSDVAFGLAFAHAQDDIKNIAENMDLYRTRMGLKTGYEGAISDYLIKTLGIRKRIKDNYNIELSPEVRKVVEGYTAGLNYWGAINLDSHYLDYFPFSKEDIIAGFAIQNLFFSGVVGAIEKLQSEDSKPKEKISQIRNHILDWGDLVLGSNAYAVNPLKSKDGSTRLMINSHQPLNGPVAWYEAHLKSEEGWNMMGGLFPGSPFIFVGFNDNLGWGLTVNKPDLSDAFLLKINPLNPNQYLLDNEWVNFKSKIIELPTKLLGPLHWTFKREARYSEHGPVLETKNGTYAIRYAGMTDIKQVDQWFKLNKSKNLNQWLKAMELRSIISFNAIYADSESNILFLHNSSSPLRSESVNWIDFVDGTNSELIWNEIVPFKEIPLLINPKSGWLVSTNQDPFKVTSEEFNLDRSNYSKTLGLQTRMTNRANRALELFNENNSISEEVFKAIKFDNKYSIHSRAFKYLQTILTHEFNNKALIESQQVLQNWNLSTSFNNKEATLGVCIISPEWLSEQTNTDPPDPISVFNDCTLNITNFYGRIDPLWSERNFLIRGNKKLPVQGGPDTLRAIYGTEQADGSLKASGGDGLYIYVEWNKNKKIKSESVHQFGSATQDQNSIHYDDQMELYVNEKMKSTFFNTFHLKKNIESTIIVPFR